MEFEYDNLCFYIAVLILPITLGVASEDAVGWVHQMLPTNQAPVLHRPPPAAPSPGRSVQLFHNIV